MKKGIKIALIILFMALIGVGSYFIAKTITESYLKETKTVEDINLKSFISKFNENLKDNNIDTELSAGEVEADSNKTYWIDIEEDIDIAIMMDKVTKDKEKDIVRITGLAFSTDYEDSKKINTYLKVMLKTNNSKLSDKDIEKMIENANDMSNSTKEDGNETSKTFDHKGLGIDKNINSESTIYRIARYNKY